MELYIKMTDLKPVEVIAPVVPTPEVPKVAEVPSLVDFEENLLSFNKEDAISALQTIVKQESEDNILCPRS